MTTQKGGQLLRLSCQKQGLGSLSFVQHRRKQREENHGEQTVLNDPWEAMRREQRRATEAMKREQRRASTKDKDLLGDSFALFMQLHQAKRRKDSSRRKNKKKDMFIVLAPLALAPKKTVFDGSLLCQRARSGCGASLSISLPMSWNDGEMARMILIIPLSLSLGLAPPSPLGLLLLLLPLM